MSRTIDLDFYIPAKDSEKYVRACLESIFRQTLRPRSVTLYLHTPCQDKTRAIAEEFPVRIREVNVPLSDVRNIALRELTSEWIGCCDVDVVLESDWLEKLWEKKDGYTIISGNTQERIQTFGDRCRSLLSPHNWGAYDVDNPYNFAPDMIARRQRLVDIGGYKSGLFNYEDSEICQRLKAQGDVFYYAANAHATHIREDDFVSWLNQRWNYSFPRQKELYETAEKYARKILNNMALTTTLLQKLVDQGEEIRNLIDALQMPIHHFKKDLAYIEKNNPSIASTVPYDFFLRTYARFYQHAHAVILGKKEKPSEKSDVSTPNDGNPYAVEDGVWSEKIDVLIATVRNLFGEELSQTPVVDLARTKTSLPETGIAFFRQRIFPADGPFFTCRDVTEHVASKGRRLLWTETFQGSTLCAFTTREKVRIHR